MLGTNQTTPAKQKKNSFLPPEALSEEKNSIFPHYNKGSEEHGHMSQKCWTKSMKPLPIISNWIKCPFLEREDSTATRKHKVSYKRRTTTGSMVVMLKTESIGTFHTPQPFAPPHPITLDFTEVFYCRCTRHIRKTYKSNEFCWPKASLPTALRISTCSRTHGFFPQFITSINDSNKNPSCILNPQNTQFHNIVQTTRSVAFSSNIPTVIDCQNIYIKMTSIYQITRSHVALCHFLVYYRHKPQLHFFPTLAMKACPFPPGETTSGGCHFKIPLPVRILLLSMKCI